MPMLDELHNAINTLKSLPKGSSGALYLLAGAPPLSFDKAEIRNDGQTVLVSKSGQKQYAVLISAIIAIEMPRQAPSLSGQSL